jgi:hypothetical protein
VGSKQAPADRAFFPGLRAGSARIPPQRGPKAGGFPCAQMAALQNPGSGVAVDADALAIDDEAVASGALPGAAFIGRPEQQSSTTPAARRLRGLRLALGTAERE